ncbi:MAG: hypothetical protein B7Y05_09160 [Polynucleobacter sp. 24-46-87]|jgi:hypothetical protein|nr:MAG: hypothetical protein B7Y05_09160 [Polynucleobacter sp. 24-46-87]OZA41326.1 MAG: hypothetical protein B7X83_02545 [Polynucleobacter sp. 17-46-58]OZB48750.1 MAG: hypothetical protein B7X60_03210 [Polynucleobacter sp. 39-45-136]HQR84985.1 hypothetical protein [Polynucleobacter sp.]HQS60633.1 hypothetical protein [Polynucleobacter sp.]
MFKKLFEFILPARSSFVIEEIDPIRNVVVLEDKQFGIRAEVNIGNKELKTAKIAGPYCVVLHYKDGTSKKARFMK